MSLTLKPRTIAIVLGSIAILLALQSIYAEYVLTNHLGIESNTAPARLLDLFSVNLEESIPTWYSSILLLLAAALLLWVALSKRQHQEPYRAHWFGLALIFLYLSMDEGSAIHESFSGPLQSAFGTSGFLEFGWLILGVPLVLFFGIAYLRFWLKLPMPTRLLFAIAGAVYVGGAVVIESLSANQYSADGGSSFLYLAIATVEELCEMLGVVILIYALLDYLVRRDDLLVLQTRAQQSEQPAVSLDWRIPRVAAFGALAAALLAFNVGMLVWGLALRDADDLQTASAPYHFFIIVDQLAAEGVNITHISGMFNPADAQSRRTVAALRAEFPAVQVLSLPNRNASVAIASDAPVLTSESIIDLMEWIDETEYIFFDTDLIEEIIGLPA